VISGGKDLDDFPENQLTKPRAVYTVLQANRGPKCQCCINWLWA